MHTRKVSIDVQDHLSTFETKCVYQYAVLYNKKWKRKRYRSLFVHRLSYIDKVNNDRRNIQSQLTKLFILHI